ncbi:spore germination protein [Bacillus sp. 03113]|uniref:spore germination protein n=1 Tax=Bacillus sp. 03113 TaxID=2578211 RepID=UPI0011442615|nr:spore germination protein [Bacillus sp. 03113]
MIGPKEQITTQQVAVILINTLLAVGILTLPRTSVEKIKTPDVWISVILGGLITILAGIVMVKLSQRFPKKTVYQYSEDIVGKWVGRLVSLVMVIYFFTVSAFEVRTLAEVTGFLLLEGTPSWAVIMPFMWVGLYLIIGGINPMAQLFEMILPVTVILFLLIAMMSFKLFEIDHLRPVLGAGIISVLKGVKTTTLAFTGLEYMLFLVAFMQKPDKAVKAMLVGITIPMFFYVITVVRVIGAFSIDGMVSRTWPTIDLMRSFEIPGLIFERFKSLLLVIWIMQIFTSFTFVFYVAALGLAQLFKKSINPFIYGLIPVIYIISAIPRSIDELFKLGDIIGNAALYLFGLPPLILLIISKWRGGKHEA